MDKCTSSKTMATKRCGSFASIAAFSGSDELPVLAPGPLSEEAESAAARDSGVSTLKVESNCGLRLSRI